MHTADRHHMSYWKSLTRHSNQKESDLPTKKAQGRDEIFSHCYTCTPILHLHLFLLFPRAFYLLLDKSLILEGSAVQYSASPFISQTQSCKHKQPTVRR